MMRRPCRDHLLGRVLAHDWSLESNFLSKLYTGALVESLQWRCLQSRPGFEPGRRRSWLDRPQSSRLRKRFVSAKESFFRPGGRSGNLKTEGANLEVGVAAFQVEAPHPTSNRARALGFLRLSDSNRKDSGSKRPYRSLNLQTLRTFLRTSKSTRKITG